MIPIGNIMQNNSSLEFMHRYDVCTVKELCVYCMHVCIKTCYSHRVNYCMGRREQPINVLLSSGCRSHSASTVGETAT